MSALRRFMVIVLGAAPLVHAAQAQPALRDPTRPPSVTPGSPGTAAAPVEGAPQRLESILISPTRRVAVIDGRPVTVGGKVDDATVVEIAEAHVLLRQGAEVRKLPLYPGIERKPTKRENRP